MSICGAAGTRCSSSVRSPTTSRPIDPAYAGGTQLGKRYVHEASGLEVLCTKPGDGALSVGTDVLELKGTKALPSSD